MSSESKTVLVADPEPAKRQGIGAFLDIQGYSVACPDIPDEHALLRLAKKVHHDTLLLSAHLPAPDLLGIIRNYEQLLPENKIAVHDLLPDSAFMRQLFLSGTKGFLGQDAPFYEFSACLLAIQSSGSFISSDLLESVFTGAGKIGICAANIYGLTERELEILELLADGFGNKQIAGRFELSVRTVEAHRFSIRRKTSSNTKTEFKSVLSSIHASPVSGLNARQASAQQMAG